MLQPQLVAHLGRFHRFWWSLPHCTVVLKLPFSGMMFWLCTNITLPSAPMCVATFIQPVLALSYISRALQVLPSTLLLFQSLGSPAAAQAVSSSDAKIARQTCTNVLALIRAVLFLCSVISSFSRFQSSNKVFDICPIAKCSFGVLARRNLSRSYSQTDFNIVTIPGW